MARVVRLTVVVVLACLSVFWWPSYAQSSLPAGDVGTHIATTYCVSFNDGQQHCGFPDPGTACNAAFPHYWGAGNGLYISDDGGCGVLSASDGVQHGVFVYPAAKEGPVCNDPNSHPDPSVPNNAACKCASGHTTSGNASCRETTDADCGAAGTASSESDDAVYPRGSGGGACVNGCKLHGGSSACSGSQCYVTGPYQNTGQACNSSQNSTPADPNASACAKQGMGVGTVNGVSVCVPATSTSHTTTSSTQATSASGVSSSSTTTTETTDNGDGSTTTTTTTTRSDGSTRTTTTTGPTPSGAASGAGGNGTGADVATFCKANPNSPLCKVSSFGGTCSSAFTCDGDAVQCAIAKEQHERDCAFFDPASTGQQGADQVNKFNQAVQDGDVPSWSPSSSGAQSSAPLDMASGISTDRTWGSSCVADQVINLVGGQSVVIPWSKYCDALQLIGKMVLACTWLVCAFVVFGK
ncbi:MAG TPA: virulence factor TspB C-terminal domain-related protein [Burkholderiaceae bacterium]